MERANRAAMIVLVFAGVFAGAAQAGPKDWFAWSGEVSDDYLDLGNWRWANSTTPTGGGVAFGHPASLAVLLSSRHEIGRATTGTPLPQTANLADGGAYVQTYGSVEIDSGMDFNIYNGSSYTVIGGVSANGLGTDVVQDAADGGADWTGNHLQTNVHVYGGGSFACGPFSANINVSGPQYEGNLGVFAEGLAHVHVAGDYQIGGLGNYWYGGGHLSLKGYDSASTLAIDGALKATAAIPPETAPNSGAARFEVVLDATNNGGRFNTMSVGKLTIGSPSTDGPDLVKFNVALDGYSVTAGQVFPIVVAGSISRLDKTGGWVETPDDLGDLTVTGDFTPYVWDSDFTASGAVFRLHKSHNGQVGLFLEVVGGGAPTFHPGDANGDGLVNLEDFGLLKDNFGATSGALWRQGDFNHDGGINLEDFGILKDHFGHSSGDANITAIPEPATMSLLVLAGLATLRRRRK